MAFPYGSWYSGLSTSSRAAWQYNNVATTNGCWLGTSLSEKEHSDCTRSINTSVLLLCLRYEFFDLYNKIIERVVHVTKVSVPEESMPTITKCMSPLKKILFKIALNITFFHMYFTLGCNLLKLIFFHHLFGQPLLTVIINISNAYENSNCKNRTEVVTIYETLI